MPWERHFFALLPDAPARAALADIALPAGARPVDPADLHVTLAFLGTLDDAGERRALDALQAIQAQHRPSVAVSLRELQIWSPGGTVAAVAASGRDAVGELAARLQAALVARGFPAVSRAFRTHVTLARKAPLGAGPAGAQPLAAEVRWEAGSVHFLASRGPARPRYHILARAALGGGELHFSTRTPD